MRLRRRLWPVRKLLRAAAVALHRGGGWHRGVCAGEDGAEGGAIVRVTEAAAEPLVGLEVVEDSG
jgi:hypothetical protein